MANMRAMKNEHGNGFENYFKHSGPQAKMDGKELKHIP